MSSVIVLLSGMWLGLVATAPAAGAQDAAQVGCTIDGQQVDTQLPQSECDALVAIQAETDGSVVPDPLADPCTSFRVTCENGHVVELEYFEDDEGTLSSAISGLTQLQVLDLDETSITGTIPVEIGELSSLRVLALDAWMTGELPTEIGQLSNLEILLVSGNRFTGELPAEIGQLTKLEILRADYNQLSGELPVELGNLTALRSLSLYGNHFTGRVPDLGALSSLDRLDLGQNRLTGPLPESLAQLDPTYVNLRPNACFSASDDVLAWLVARDTDATLGCDRPVQVRLVGADVCADRPALFLVGEPNPGRESSVRVVVNGYWNATGFVREDTTPIVVGLDFIDPPYITTTYAGDALVSSFTYEPPPCDDEPLFEDLFEVSVVCNAGFPGRHEIQISRIDTVVVESVIELETLTIDGQPRNPQLATYVPAGTPPVLTVPIELGVAVAGVRWVTSDGVVHGLVEAFVDCQVPVPLTEANLAIKCVNNQPFLEVVLTPENDVNDDTSIRTTIRVGDGADAAVTEVFWANHLGRPPLTVVVPLPILSQTERVPVTITAEGVWDQRLTTGVLTACDVPVECDLPCHSPGDIRASVACSGTRGVLRLMVTNTSDQFRKFTATTGQTSKVRVLPPMATQNIFFSGRADGPVAWTVVSAPSSSVANLIEGTVQSECSAEDDARIDKVSCLAENGRVDVVARTPTAVGGTRLVTVIFGDLVPRERQIESTGEFERFTVTGRKDGPLLIRVLINGQTVVNETVQIACDPVPAQEVSVTQSCLAGRGRIDVDLANLDGPATTYQVIVGRIVRFSALDPGASARVTVTGRPSGPLDVIVVRNFEEISRTDLLIDC